MDDITCVRFEPLTSSAFVKPVRMTYKQDGDARSWDLLVVHDSVCCVLYHSGRRALIFVRQFRPAVYADRHYSIATSSARSASCVASELNKLDWSAHAGAVGVTYELCAGIVDKPLPLERIVHEEIVEECGYCVPEGGIERVTSCQSGVGVSGARSTIFYAVVDDTMKGGGSKTEHERLEVVYVPLADAKKLIMDESCPRPASLLFALTWFYQEKAPKLGFID